MKTGTQIIFSVLVVFSMTFLAASVTTVSHAAPVTINKCNSCKRQNCNCRANANTNGRILNRNSNSECGSCGGVGTCLAECRANRRASRASTQPCGCGQASCGQATCGAQPQQVVASCGCGTATCGGGCQAVRPACGCGQPTCATQQCPSCNNDFCTLKTEQVKEKKSCFKIEQKSVCIPPVRLPWKKCCPPGQSKTRRVNVLKKHSYECPTCKYSWNVWEPPKPAEPAKAEATPEPTYAPTTEPNRISTPEDYFEPIPSAPPTGVYEGAYQQPGVQVLPISGSTFPNVQTAPATSIPQPPTMTDYPWRANSSGK